jgi:hypothetical protein
MEGRSRFREDLRHLRMGVVLPRRSIAPHGQTQNSAHPSLTRAAHRGRTPVNAGLLFGNAITGLQCNAGEEIGAALNLVEIIKCSQEHAIRADPRSPFRQWLSIRFGSTVGRRE